MYVLIAVVAVTMLFVLINDNLLHIKGIPSMDDILSGAVFENKHATVLDNEAAVHFIDVGQGDCELITVGGMSVLIDCGEEESYGAVKRYLSREKIEKLDYVIVTHPHSDHIGGMHKVLREFEVGMVLMPRISEKITPSGRCYERMLDAIDDKNISAKYIEPNDVIFLTENARLEVLAPVYDDYDDLNNSSAVIKFVYGDTSYLLTGDIEASAEKDILKSGADVSADLLKVAHHGSAGSSTEDFLRAVSPKIAVIEVGKGNKFGHPRAETLDKLDKIGCKYYTTMAEGDIVVISDGANLRVVTKNKGEVEAA